MSYTYSAFLQIEVDDVLTALDETPTIYAYDAQTGDAINDPAYASIRTGVYRLYVSSNTLTDVLFVFVPNEADEDKIGQVALLHEKVYHTLDSRLTSTRAGYLDKLNTGVTLTAAGVDAILDEAVVGSYTMRQLLKVMAAALAGKATGGGTTTITFRGVDDASNVIVATVDANGNRSAVTLTV